MEATVKMVKAHSFTLILTIAQGMYYYFPPEKLREITRRLTTAIDKMAARFWHTDDSATFLFEKKGQKFFSTLIHGFHLKTFPTPYGC